MSILWSVGKTDSMKYLIYPFLILALIFTGCGDSEETPADGTDGAAASEQPPTQPPANVQPGIPEGVLPSAEYTDDELGLFVDALIKIQELQQAEQPKMLAVIEEHGLTVDRFNMLAQQMQQTGKAEGTPEEQQAFQTITQKFNEMQKAMEPSYEAAVKETGMDVGKYQQINMDAQQNPPLAQKIQMMIMAKMGPPPGAIQGAPPQ